MKGRRVLVTFIAACATVCIMTPSVAQAAVTCSNANMLALGERGQDIVPASGSLYYKVAVVAGRSYSIMTWAPYQEAGTSLVSLDTAFYTDSACTVAAATVDQTDREPILSTTSHNGDAVSIIPTFTGTLFVRVINSVATAYYASTVVMETSLFSPWWFTGGTNQAYVELRNNMNGSYDWYPDFLRLHRRRVRHVELLPQREWEHGGPNQRRRDLRGLHLRIGAGGFPGAAGWDGRKHNDARRAEWHLFRFSVHATHGVG